MSRHRLIAASVATVTALALVAVLALGRLPAGTQLPVHWDAAGEADRFADAGHALFLPVALAAFTSLLCAVLPRLEPLQDRLSGSEPLLHASWAGLLALSALVEAVVAGPAFGLDLGAELVLVGAGLLLMVIGNALPKSRPGFFVGIRTPWTITDPDNWIATHRFASWFFIAAGAVTAAAGLAPIEPETRAALVVAAVLNAAVTPILYSYLRWRRAARR